MDGFSSGTLSVRSAAGDSSSDDDEDHWLVMSFGARDTLEFTLGTINGRTASFVVLFGSVDFTNPPSEVTDDERENPAGGDSGGNPGGLSDAEYAEFLRSGLTLADFLARRLAATGPSDAALGLGGLSAVLFGLVGAALVLIARRQVSRKPR